jgi:hypothetical protein
VIKTRIKSPIDILLRWSKGFPSLQVKCFI